MAIDVREPNSDTASSSDAASNGRPAGQPTRQQPRLSTILRWVVSALLCLVAVGFGTTIFVSLASLKKSPPRRSVAQRSYNVTTYSVEPMDLLEVVSAFGTAAADKQVLVSAEVAGVVTDLHPNLEVGVSVKASTVKGGGPASSRDEPGDLLAKLDESTYLRRIEALERQILQSTVVRDQLILEEENEKRLLKTQEQNLKTAQEELESKQRARAAGAGSATQVRNAELQARQYEEQITRLKNSINLYESREAALQAQIDSGKAELENAQLDLERTSIMPPFDGVLSEVMVEEGQYLRPGDPLVEVTSLDQVDVTVALTQSQFARIEPLLAAGEKLAARLAENESDSPRWTGRVVRAAPVADEVTRTVDVYIEVDNSVQTTPLLPGTFVHARIDGPVLKDAIVVPRDVILSGTVYVSKEAPEVAAEDKAADDKKDDSNEADTTTVAVEQTETAETAMTKPAGPSYLARSQPVQVERSIHNFALVRAGLSAGDRIVMTNLDVVHDGAAIVPQATMTVTDELERVRVPVLRIVE